MTNWLHAVIGKIASPQKSGLALLRQTLRANNVPLEQINSAALSEIVKNCVGSARLQSDIGSENFHTALVNAIGGAATIITEIYEKNESPFTEGWIRDILNANNSFGLRTNLEGS